MFIPLKNRVVTVGTEKPSGAEGELGEGLWSVSSNVNHGGWDRKCHLSLVWIW